MRKSKSLLGLASVGAAALAAVAWCHPAQAAFVAQNFNNWATGVESGSDTPADNQVNSASELQMWDGTYTGIATRSYANAITAGSTGDSTFFTQLTLTNAVQGPTNNWNGAIGESVSSNANATSRDLFSLNFNGSGPTVPVTFYWAPGATGNDYSNGPGDATSLSLTVGQTENLWFVTYGNDGSANANSVSIYASTGSAPAALVGNYPDATWSVYGIGSAPYNPITLVSYAYGSTFSETQWPGGTEPQLDGSNSFLLDNPNLDNAGVNLANPVAAVPEPATLGLLGMAGAMLMFRRKRA